MISPERLIVLGRCYAAAWIAIYLFDLPRQMRDHFTDGAGRPLGDDFVNFWSGAFLAWHNRAAEVYNGAFHVFEQSVVGQQLGGFHYSYPPTLLVLTAPLAALPYALGFVLWVSGGLLAFYGALRLAWPEHRPLLFALATPAVFVNTIAGQNGSWSAALFGFGLGLLDRNPVLAGSLLGMLIYKPQLGILIPVALLAGRRWRAFAAATAVSLGLIVFSAVWFGPGIWTDYLQQANLERQLSLEDGSGVWHRMLSVFVAAHQLGADPTLAYLIQAIATVAAAAAVAALWWRDAPFGIRNATLVLGTCLATPYLQDYDLVFSALVVAWLWRDQDIRRPADPLFFLASAAILLLPLFGATIASLIGIAFGPILILPIFLIALSAGLNDRSNASIGAKAF